MLISDYSAGLTDTTMAIVETGSMLLLFADDYFREWIGEKDSEKSSVDGLLPTGEWNIWDLNFQSAIVIPFGISSIDF